MFTKNTLFLLVLIGFSVTLSAVGEIVPVQPFKEWSILIYGVPVETASAAIKQFDDAMSSISDEDTNAILCCDLWTEYASLWQITAQTITRLSLVLEPEKHAARIMRLMNMLMTHYPAQKYALVLQGDGANISFSELVTTLRQVSMNLGRNLDLCITDAGCKASLEVIMGVSDLVDVCVASENDQYNDGISYKALFQSLAVNGASAADVAATIVHTIGNDASRSDLQRYVAITCESMPYLWNALTDFMTQLNMILAARPALAQAIYSVRAGLDALDGAGHCIDSGQWLSAVQKVLSSASDDTEALALSLVAASLIGRIESAVLARSSQGGLSVCYSITNPAMFMVNQVGPWNQFVRASFRNSIQK